LTLSSGSSASILLFFSRPRFLAVVLSPVLSSAPLAECRSTMRASTSLASNIDVDFDFDDITRSLDRFTGVTLTAGRFGALRLCTTLRSSLHDYSRPRKVIAVTSLEPSQPSAKNTVYMAVSLGLQSSH